MNKTLREATTDEIKNAYINKVPLVIWNYRKASIEYDIDYEDGVVNRYCRFNLSMAKRYNLAFEYRIWQSNKLRKERVLKRVKKIINNGNAIFVTLTFNDKFLNRSTSETTRRRYVSRFLKEQCLYYIANIDYGESQKGTHREHYHALVIPKGEKIDYASYSAYFDKSRIFAEPVIISGKSEDNIAKYISKLTNHSLKSSGQYKKLIYSRVKSSH